MTRQRRQNRAGLLAKRRNILSGGLRLSIQARLRRRVLCCHSPCNVSLARHRPCSRHKRGILISVQASIQRVLKLARLLFRGGSSIYPRTNFVIRGGRISYIHPVRPRNQRGPFRVPEHCPDNISRGQPKHRQHLGMAQHDYMRHAQRLTNSTAAEGTGAAWRRLIRVAHIELRLVKNSP